MERAQVDFGRPRHVPEDLYVAENLWEGMGALPHARMRAVAAGRDIIYLRHHHHKGHSPNGAWLAASSKANRAIMLDTDAFPTSGATVFGKLLGGLIFFPVESDPPEHASYRALLAPFFKPTAVTAMKDSITRRVDELLDQILPRRECDFVAEFARLLPASIFLDQMGLPQEHAREFLDWARTAMSQQTSVEDKVAALHRIRDYLAEKIEVCRSGPDDGTLLAALARGEIDGRPLTMEESLGGSMVVFLGGLDTVANLLGWVFYELSTNSALQQTLRQHPERQGRALEELLRFYSPVTVSRLASRDIQLFGAPIKAGDTVCCSMTLGSRDDEEFHNPDQLDISQPPRRHMAFGFGPHTCIGMHLARLETTVVLQRWLARTKGFSLAPGAEVPMRGSVVLGVDDLRLEIV